MNEPLIQNLLAAAAARWRDSSALSVGAWKLTYGEVDERSNRLANYLLAQGARRGSILAVLSDDRVEIVLALLATLKAGVVFAPLDPGLPGNRLRATLAELSPDWCLIEERSKFVAGAVPGVAASAVFRADAAEVFPSEAPEVAHDPDECSYIYFTSGSSGRPKGIMGRLRALAHYVSWEIAVLGLQPGNRVSQLMAPSFDAFLRDVLTPLCSGGVICIPERRELLLDSRELLNWLDTEQIDLVHCVPSLFRTWLAEDLRATRLTALRFILLSGETLLGADVRRWTETYGERIRLVNLYGPTETTMTKFSYFVRAADAGRRHVPIGKPMQGVRALIVDGHGRVCVPGAVGEIYIRTPFRSLGYFQQPELTVASFIRNPFGHEDDDIVYKTGDLGRILEDGNFEFLGRADQQIKIRGVRVELGEVEGALRTHPAVREAAVVDHEGVDGDRWLCAYVVLAPGGETTVLPSFLRALLPEVMIPARFVAMRALARTITGKLDRRALPDPAPAERTQPPAPARTPCERQLLEIFAVLLGRRDIGIHDSFFDLGGHSLVATRLLSRVDRIFGVELPLSALFSAPTAAALAQVIAAAVGSRPDAALACEEGEI